MSAGGNSQAAPSMDSQQSHQSFLKYLEEFQFPFMQDVSKYEKIIKIGQGTFGEVFKAKCKKTGTVVALKKILMENEKEGFPITALREIKLLQKLNHPNVTELLEICSSKASAFNRTRATFYLVFTFCEHDLAGLLSNRGVKFSMGEIKEVVKQLMEGLFFVHAQKILHRDMKAANILITKNGTLKLADFGLARPLMKANPKYTNRVVTLWYRPPELLLGERNYTTAIDIWGAGCIMAEMWTRNPIMQGTTETHQLQLISQLCGSITPEVWPGVEKMDLYQKMEVPQGHKRILKERVSQYCRDVHALDLIDQLLKLDPTQRIDADRALNHQFFWSDPMPCPLQRMLSQHSQSMFEYLAPAHRQGAGPAHRQGGQPQNKDHYQDRVF